LKDDHYQEFYNQLFDMSQKAFDFKKVFITRTVDRFWADERAQVLIVRGSDELISNLKDEDGLYTLYVARNQNDAAGKATKYDKVIVQDSLFEDSVKQTLDTLLLKDKEIEKV
jgi:hypothetical protein